jgi:hypothetical protein
MYKVIFNIIAMVFFIAITLVILIGAYAQSQIDLWIVGALAVMILWNVYERVCDNFKTRRK